MPKALIVSLGGTINPIIKSIESHQPAYLCFFCSQESQASEYPKVKQRLDEMGVSPKIESIIVDDVNDLVHCYEKALDIATKIEKRGISSEDVVVDYTGGTKNMTAALVLATVTKGYKFSYVGGKERTKEGLGIVISGSEEVRESLSPWRVLFVEDRKRMALFFNSYQFSAARDIAGSLSSFISGLDRAIYNSLSKIIEGYRLWDSFNHAKAFEILSEGKEKFSEYLELKKDPVLSDFLKSVRTNLAFLGELKGRTKEFKEKHFLMVFDIFYNAKRRAEEGKYDDGVARLYRGLEMIGQIEFEKIFKCPTSDVAAEKLSDTIKDEIVRRHKATDGKIKIPLYDTFRILKEVDNLFGKLFHDKKGEIGKILFARNNSILAHGATPISKDSFEKLSLIVEDFIKNTGLNYKVEFPKLLWE